MYLLLFGRHTYVVIRDAVAPRFIFCGFNRQCLFILLHYVFQCYVFVRKFGILLSLNLNVSLL